MTKRFQSTNLREASYDPITARLLVTFQNNAVYEYARVPPVVWWHLVQADSPGGYFARDIRKQFTHRKVK